MVSVTTDLPLVPRYFPAFFGASFLVGFVIVRMYLLRTSLSSICSSLWFCTSRFTSIGVARMPSSNQFDVVTWKYSATRATSAEGWVNIVARQLVVIRKRSLTGSTSEHESHDGKYCLQLSSPDHPYD